MSVLVLAGCGAISSTNDFTGVLDDENRIQDGEITAWVQAGKNTKYLEFSMNQYNKKYGTNLKLNTVDVANSTVVEKLTPILASNEPLPEIIFMGDGLAPILTKDFPNAFVDLTKIGFESQSADLFYPSKIASIKQASSLGDLYGFPIDLGTVLMYYRDDIFKEAGIDISTIKTYDDLYNAGIKIKEKTGKYLLSWDSKGDYFMFNTLMQSQGKQLINADGEIDIQNTEAKNAIEWMKKCIDAGLIQYYTNEDEKYSIVYDSAVILEGGWLIGNIAANDPDNYGNWRVASAPLWNSSLVTAPISGGSSWYVGANSPNAKAALQFLNFATTDPTLQEEYVKLGSTIAVPSAYDNEYVKGGQDYFGGENVFEPFLKASPNTVGQNFSSAQTELQKNIALEIVKVFNGEEEINTALENAAKSTNNTTGVGMAKEDYE